MHRVTGASTLSCGCEKKPFAWPWLRLVAPINLSPGEVE
jgi:hypothetical protein